MAQTVTRYSTVAIWLHWLIALLIIGMMIAGVWMAGAIKVKETQATAFEVYQLHKSIGVTIFALSLFRLFWRLGHQAPDMPTSMALWEKIAANLTHWAFYGLMIGLPITGWLMVSASPWGLPTMYFNTFEVPHFTALAELDQAGKTLWEARFKGIHKFMAYSGIALVLLHVGAALKHQFWERDNLISRMMPSLKKTIK